MQNDIALAQTLRPRGGPEQAIPFYSDLDPATRKKYGMDPEREVGM
jgi:hypothetical protein